VIVGGESGPGARPMQKEWVLSSEISARSEVPFFFKQWGASARAKPGRELDGRTYTASPVASTYTFWTVPAFSRIAEIEAWFSPHCCGEPTLLPASRESAGAGSSGRHRLIAGVEA